MKEEYSILYYLSANEQTIVSATKPVMKKTVLGNDLSTLLLHMAMSWASESFQVFCFKHSIEQFVSFVSRQKNQLTLSYSTLSKVHKILAVKITQPSIYLSSMDAKAAGITAVYHKDGLSLQAFSLEVHYIMTQLSIPLLICS